MGADIHTLVQIKRNGNWDYIPELPKEFNERNYKTFSVLGNVRNNFENSHFPVKGLPKDLDKMKYGWQSHLAHAKENYEKEATIKVKMIDGAYLSTLDDSFKRYVEKEEFEQFKGNKGHSNDGYYIYDYEYFNGQKTAVPYKKLYSSFKEFLDEHYKDEYDTELDDYGHYDVDFSDNDLHSHSYLTLAELESFDLSDYKSFKCKLAKEFYDKFLELGGTLPKGMMVMERKNISNFVDALREAFEPTVIIKWHNDEDTPLENGILSLNEIANKYGILSKEDIRIVFAFDN